ncbi:MAG: hypothetical protein M3Y81_03580 [Chloroflexota bacterium]|nr:hypothetical protein [Chloroflexota bacterium]
MQNRPYRFPDDPLCYVRQTTDTAHPQTVIPIYYIHSVSAPFCRNPLCACQRSRRAVTQLGKGIAEGEIVLQPSSVFTDEEEARNTTGPDQPTRTIVTVVLIDGIPEECQLYGHSWKETGNAHVKACSLCGTRGYCPGCAPVKPQGAQPFYCSAHARTREVP